MIGVDLDAGDVQGEEVVDHVEDSHRTSR